MAANNANAKTEQLSGSNLIIVLALLSLLAVGGAGLASKALITGIIRDTKVVSAKQKADKQLKDNVTAAPSLISSFDALGGQKSVLADALPATADLPSLIVSIENMSAAAGVTVKSVSAVPADSSLPAGSASGSSSGAATPQVYPFSITFDGSYDSVKRLLGAIEVSARPMRVVSMQLSGSGSTLSGQLGIETYYQANAQLPFSEETIK